MPQAPVPNYQVQWPKQQSGFPRPLNKETHTEGNGRMPQAAVPTYRVEYEPSRGSWLLTGPVGAKGRLRYKTARDAAEYVRWDARDSGGTIDVFDKQGQLYRKICIKADALADSAFVLPSV